MSDLEFHKYQFEIVIEILQSRRFIIALTREEIKDIESLVKHVKRLKKNWKKLRLL